MKKTTAVMIMFFMLASISTTAFAQSSEEGPMTKLGRGLLNVLDAVTEIPGTVMRESQSEGVATGMTKGAVLGVMNTIVRAVVGVYEVATFPVPAPEGYQPILDEPKFLSTE